jgi:hypothetical protein
VVYVDLSWLQYAPLTHTRGERVEVSDDNTTWCERIYLTTVEGAEHPVMVVVGNNHDEGQYDR